MSCEQQKQDNTSCETKFSIDFVTKPTITEYFTQKKNFSTPLLITHLIFFVTCRFLYNQTHLKYIQSQLFMVL